MPARDRLQGTVAGIEPRYLGLGELFLRIRDAVVVGDAGTGRVVLWNDAATRLFGYTAEEAADLLIEDLVPESLKQSHRRGLRRFADSGRGRLIDSAQIVELPAVRKDGSEVFVELSLTPLESDRLEGRYAMAIVRDVTERKEAEARIRRLDELKNTFIATVAHDIRSPMAAVSGLAEILRSDPHRLDEAERLRCLDAISRSAAKVSRLVADVLEVAALDSGEVPYAMDAVDLGSTIGQTVEEMRAAHPTIRFDVRLPSPLSLVRADPGRIWQVLVNLFANAAAFTEAGGCIEVSARMGNGVVEVSVRDQGPGIMEADQNLVFEKFSRVSDVATRERAHGTGLGLYICRAILEAHGGTIRVESAAGQGTTFTFSVPVIEQA